MEAEKEMMEYRNTIHLGDFMTNGLPNHCCDLIIADPPYYRVKGDFDQVWETFGDYLKDVERWAAELARLMSYNGTLVWFGSHRSIAYIQVILDRSFHLLNNCTILKKNSIQKVLANMEAQRSFFSNDERFLVYESNSEEKNESLGGKAKNYYNTRLGLLRSKCVKPVIDYMNGERIRAGFTVSQINKALGTYMASHWFTYKSQFELPTPEWYGRLRDLFNGRGGEFLRKDYEELRKDYEELRKDYEELRKDYEELRKDYEELRRPFSMADRQTDVFSVTWDSGASSRLGHPTVKDIRLIRTLVRSLSRPGQLVLEPFMGSGSACLAAKELGRDYIGYELEDRYYRIAEKRLHEVQGIIL